MGIRRSLVLVALVACKPKGLMVEVPGDNVELFVAASEATCGSGNALCSMAPPDPNKPGAPGAARQAKRWITNTDDLVSADREVTNGWTNFLIEPDPQLTTIPALLAVSFDGPNTNANVIGFQVVPDVDVRPGSQERLHLSALEPFMPLVPATATTVERMQLWRKPSDSQPNVVAKDSACVLVGHATGATYPFESFSPPSDTDCDEAEKVHECDKFAAFSTRLPTDTELSCLAPPADPTGLCIVGGASCVDGVDPKTSACVASRQPYCASTKVCATASSAACTSPLAIDCATPQVTSLVQNGLVGLHCDYAYDSAMTPCMSSGTASVHLTAVLPAGLPCQDVLVSAPTNPLAFDTTADLTLGSKTMKVTIASVTTTDCTVVIKVEPSATPQSGFLAYLAIEAAVPATMTMPGQINHYVVPIVIDPALTASGCNGVPNPVVCLPLAAPDLNDTIKSCR